MDTQTSVDVNVSAKTAFALLSDFSKNPDWQDGMVRCTWTSTGAIDVGSTYEQ